MKLHARHFGHSQVEHQDSGRFRSPSLSRSAAEPKLFTCMPADARTRESSVRIRASSSTTKTSGVVGIKSAELEARLQSACAM